jgi:hypothetical protein
MQVPGCGAGFGGGGGVLADKNLAILYIMGWALFQIQINVPAGFFFNCCDIAYSILQEKYFKSRIFGYCLPFLILSNGNRASPFCLYAVMLKGKVS